MNLLPDWMRLRMGKPERITCWIMLALFLLSVPLIIFFNYNIFTWYVCLPVLLLYLYFVWRYRTDDPLLLAIPPKQ
jgi:hypothetical protein